MRARGRRPPPLWMGWLRGLPMLGVVLIALAPGGHAAAPDSAAALEPPVAAGPATSRVRADRLVDRVVDGEPVTYLLGNVFIDRDTLSVRCDTALHYRRRDVYDFSGSVRLQQRDAVLTSPRAVYRRGEQAADFTGGVRVEEVDLIGTALRAESREDGRLLRLLGDARLVAPEYTVWADTIARTGAEGEGEAWGRIRIVDPTSQTLVTGRHALFHGGRGSAVVDSDPVLTSRNRTEGTLVGRARLMRFQKDPERIVMLDSVRIVEQRREATADTALILGQDRMVLRGRPRVRDGDQSVMTGREIEFVYQGGRLELVFLRGAARVEDSSPDSLARLYPGLPKLDVLEGDTIVVEFVAGQARRSRVTGSARSVYVPTDVDDEIAFNDVRGDTIIIDFRAGRIDEVQVRGSMAGDYYFAPLAELVRAKAVSDSLAEVGQVPGDRSAADTVSPDSLASAASTDSVFTLRRQQVEYSGRSVRFNLPRRRIEIEGEADLTYGDLNLKARKVRLDTVSKELYADGDPLLVDSSQKIVGRRMGYNFDSRTGAVQDGVTEFDRYYYTGKHVRRYADGSLKIGSGRMTSCDLERPHYHFWADQMKISLKDMVVAKPIVLKIGEVPVFALPFYFKSLKSGRRSGILFPNFNFGWSSREGRYIRDFGYYWATNDYTDFTFRGDYNERRELMLRLSNRYVKRYGFTGSVDYSRSSSLAGQELRQWQLSWQHNHERLFDEYNFRTDLRMTSRTLTRDDLDADIGRDIVSGQNHSTMLLSRSWRKVSASLNFTRDEQVNAEDDIPSTDQLLVTQQFPQLNLSFQRLSLLPPLARGRRGTFLGGLLRNTYFTQSYAYSQTRTERELTDRTSTTARNSAGLDIRPPRLGFLNLSAGARGGQTWQRVTEKGELYSTGVDSIFDPPHEFDIFTPFYRRRDTTTPSLSLSGAANTTLYGVLPLHVGRLRALRHTFTAAVGYSLSPAISGKQQRSESFSLSAGHRFDIKYAGGPDDTSSRLQKLDGVLDWRLSTSYNPNAVKRSRWSDINSDIAIKPGRSRNLDFRVGNTIDPYEFRVLATRISYGLNISGQFDTGGEAIDVATARNQALSRLGVSPDTTRAVADTTGADLDDPTVREDPAAEFAGFARPVAAAPGEDPTRGGRFIPWTLSSSISYSKNNETGASSARASLNLSAALTRAWRVEYQAAFDLDSGAITRQSWNLNRDLHCWALEFSRVVSAVDQQFGFRLYLKKIPAVEVTRGRRDLLGAAQRFGSGGIF